jgi:hypothetical protein
MSQPEIVIKVGPNGTFKRSGNYYTSPEALDDILDSWEKTSDRNINLYFHGGLVSEAQGLEVAAKIGNALSSCGSLGCFVWETGLQETFRDNIHSIYKTKLFNKLLRLIIKKAAEKILFKAGARGVIITLSDDQIEEELKRPKPFENDSQTNPPLYLARQGGFGTSGDENLWEKQLTEEMRRAIVFDVDLFNELTSRMKTSSEGEETNERSVLILAAKKVVSILIRVLKRTSNKKDHGFYPTIVEELFREFFIADLGEFVWTAMKTKAALIWHPNEGETPDQRSVGGYVLERLYNIKKSFPEKQINLLGHSAGSIALCELLKSAGQYYPDLKFNSIIFLAPACRVDLFQEAIIAQSETFSTFRMYTMSDEYEMNDILIPGVYTRSLLYLVSGLFEPDSKDGDAYILGMNRYFKGLEQFENDKLLQSIKAFLQIEEGLRCILSLTNENALPGLRCNATSHGNFDDDQETFDSLCYHLNK